MAPPPCWPPGLHSRSSSPWGRDRGSGGGTSPAVAGETPECPPSSALPGAARLRPRPPALSLRRLGRRCLRRRGPCGRFQSSPGAVGFAGAGGSEPGRGVSPGPGALTRSVGDGFASFLALGQLVVGAGGWEEEPAFSGETEALGRGRVRSPGCRPLGSRRAARARPAGE